MKSSCSLMDVGGKQSMEFLLFRGVHFIEINTQFFNQCHDIRPRHATELVCPKIQKIEECLRGGGDEKLKCAFDEGEIPKELLIDGLICKCSRLRLICPCDFGRDGRDCLNCFRGEIVILQRRPRADIRWSAQHIRKVEQIGGILPVFAECVSRYIH